MSTEQDNLKILLFTFNCGQVPQNSTAIRKALWSTIVQETPKLQQQSDLPDIIFLSLQELGPIYDFFLWGNADAYLTPFIDAVTHLTEISHAVFGHVATCSAGLVFGVLFRRVQSASIKISNVRTSVVKFGYFETGLKGAASIRVDVSSDTSSTELTFVAAHLTANEGYREIRDHNFQDIARKAAFFAENSISLRKEDGTDREFLYKDGSQVFILGDLNYRVAVSPNAQPSQPAATTVPRAASALPDQCKPTGNNLPIQKWVAPQHSFVEEWLRDDELSISRKHAGTAFFGYNEADVTFPPTYKFNSNREYTPRRVPSWCDRVLYFDMFEGGSGVKIDQYASLPEVDKSDHIPVYAMGTVPIKKPGGLSEQLVTILHKNDIAASTVTTCQPVLSRGVTLDRQVSPAAIRARQVKLQNRHIIACTGRIKTMEKLIGGLMYLVLTPTGNGILLAAIVGLVSVYVSLRTSQFGVNSYRTGKT
ncbi:Endonuclease/exonuclease/phosphatase [Lipomyces orientalis]|uniref:Endonuclease/exonuclease/phosphatase n=1 Tax=Lipomyces orientalis TaxID=1233043 RepID=A0ACC3TH61_9ASCO